jgi:hypothetical protein
MTRDTVEIEHPTSRAMSLIDVITRLPAAFPFPQILLTKLSGQVSACDLVAMSAIRLVLSLPGISSSSIVQ